MLTLNEISRQFPANLQPFRRNMLREYLQCKMLELIFASEQAPKLSFIGGTALRLVHDHSRFSEDLDFDNFGLAAEEFDALAGHVRTGLEAEGLPVEISTVAKGAYRCNVRLPRLLFENELSGYPEEKILIQIDTVAQGFAYQPDRKILNRFDVFAEILVTPPDILLSQKLYAALNRKRAKGRDFYDIVFLLSFAKPNYAYLEQKIGVTNGEDLRARMLEAASTLDFAELARDVEPFLFQSSDKKKVELFPTFIRQAAL